MGKVTSQKRGTAAHKKKGREKGGVVVPSVLAKKERGEEDLHDRTEAEQGTKKRKKEKIILLSLPSSVDAKREKKRGGAWNSFLHRSLKRPHQGKREERKKMARLAPRPLCLHWRNLRGKKKKRKEEYGCVFPARKCKRRNRRRKEEEKRSRCHRRLKGKKKKRYNIPSKREKKEKIPDLPISRKRPTLEGEKRKKKSFTLEEREGEEKKDTLSLQMPLPLYRRPAPQKGKEGQLYALLMASPAKGERGEGEKRWRSIAMKKEGKGTAIFFVCRKRDPSSEPKKGEGKKGGKGVSPLSCF